MNFVGAQTLGINELSEVDVMSEKKDLVFTFFKVITPSF